MSSNYPPGVTDAHPHFNPPAEVECDNCGEDVYPGSECHECGEYAYSVDEMREFAEEEAAERRYDMMAERAEMEDADDPFEEY